MRSKAEFEEFPQDIIPNIYSFTKEDMAEYYQYPISKAAQKLGCCATIVKLECRRLEIERWPHRVHNALTYKLKIVDESKLSQEIKDDMIDGLKSKLKKLAKNPNLKLKQIIDKSEDTKIKVAVRKANKIKPSISGVVKSSPIKKNASKRPVTVASHGAPARAPDTHNQIMQELQAISILSNLSSAHSKPPSVANSRHSLFSMKAAHSTSRLYLIDKIPSNAEFAAYRNAYIYCEDNLYHVSKACDVALLSLFDRALFEDAIAKVVAETSDERVRILPPDVVMKVITWNTIPSEIIEQIVPGMP